MLNFLINSITRAFRGEAKLEKKIRTLTGFRTGKTYLYRSALTHKSLKYKGNGHSRIDNERLEFLGDAILSSVIADYLFTNYPQCKEGFLTKMRSKMVNRENLNQIAVKLGFDKLVLLNITGVPVRKHVFGNALEAIIGAIYLDKGYIKAKKFVINKIIMMHPDLDKLACEDRDFKSRIIQWGQKNKQEISFESYEVNQVNMNEPAFVAKVHIMDSIAGEGSGTTKKEAQQHAARQALESLSS